MAAPAPSLGPLGHASAGAAASTVAMLLTYPWEVARTRSNAERSTKSTVEMLKQCLDESGVSGLYRGWKAAIIASIARDFCTFFFYELLRPRYSALCAGDMSKTAQFVLGCHAAAMSASVTHPTSTITVRMQANKDPAQANSFLRTLLHILNTESPTRLWSGLLASLILSVNVGISFLVYEKLKEALVAFLARSKRSATMLHFFLIGAVAKAVASTITYPYIYGKVCLQSGAKKADGTPLFPDLTTFFTTVLRADGVAGLFRGLVPHISKSVLSQAITFMLKEKAAATMLQLSLVLANSRHKTQARAAVAALAGLTMTGLLI
eukprot:GGOE01006205.1.p2 GENE.GGOE01006205.1~~GGOE01006205.1.p2  ORF type:complete len:322 (-),score=128.74 GGOE01006205.1:507-1472(-)